VNLEILVALGIHQSDIIFKGIIYNMKLNDVLAPYKYFTLATPEDGKEILNFFREITMDMKSFKVRFDRGNDFFEFCNEQGKKTFVFVIKDESKKITGTGSIALIDHYLNGKKETCAYLGDLRISPKANPKIRIHWKKFYGELISNFEIIEEFKGVKFLYTAILDENQNALRSLLKNNEQFLYHELSTYQAVNVFIKKPFANISKELKVTHLNENDLLSFLSQVSKLNGFQPAYDLTNDNELTRRKTAWEGFAFSDFLSVKNPEGKIIASTLPRIFKSKKLVVEDMNTAFQLLSKILPVVGIPKINDGEPINILYLTHLTFHPDSTSIEKTEALSVILNHLLVNRKKNQNKFHFISYFDFPQWNISELPFFTQKTPAKLYQVLKFQNPEPFDLHHQAPAFEIGIS
jgi:hypothetical protein